ncbi:hypothetical protein A4A49_42067 [Nicotiana attenuata]|uniref:Uncharacterized protein n=1 Tax=Nicotiana attenuata TaxID=49451 RepID=A0A1J6KIS3_NICAT|nr:hypothetical protein A4A49_42067 [Nicotiana attenuata]
MSVSNVSQRNGLASMKSSGLLLLHLLPSQLSNPNNHSLLLFFPQKPQQLTAANSLSVHILSQPLHLCRSSKWDPNVESIKNQNFIKFGDFENEEEEEFDRDEILDQGAQVLEEYIDSIWIFKVPFLLLLPFILQLQFHFFAVKFVPFFFLLYAFRALEFWIFCFKFGSFWDGYGVLALFGALI